MVTHLKELTLVTNFIVWKTIKVTSDLMKTANFVDKLYNSIIKAGTHKASSIKAAESAKIIENSQRDINIAFMNEISLVFVTRRRYKRSS